MGEFPAGPMPAHMHSIVDHVLDAIITIDAAGTITTFNPAAERIFGYRAAEVAGRNVKMLMPEPDRSAHDAYLGHYLETGEKKIIGKGREVEGLRNDGTTFPMELAISEFQVDGQRYFTGIVRDITERKRTEEALRRAEERMRSVLDNVIDGIITIDERGTIESFNPAAEKLFGYGRDEVIGRNVNVLMPEPYHGEHDGYLANYVRTGHARIIGVGREVVGRRKDGSTFPMELAVGEFRIGDGRHFTGIVRDITERKRLESQLRERLAELAEADRQKNEFLAMLSHELRNPLAPMRNALYLMKVAKGDEVTIGEAQAMIDRQLQHLMRLVDDLLDVSRIVRGKIELRLERMDLRQAVRRAVETAQPVVDASGHRLEVSVPDEALPVTGDLIRLAQAISNLLVNAAKYSPGGSHIWLAAVVHGASAVVTVRDEGSGIAPELLPRIFDLFVQGESTLARSQGGLGIGLTLVQRLVEMHRGTVSAASAGPGHGSSFTMVLPLAEAARPAPDERAERLAGTARRGHHVLVVDDNVDAAESIARILRLFGHKVTCAFDGPTALGIAERMRPDVVVLDIGLPGMDGYEVARRLRQRPGFERTPLIAVTGYGQERDRERSREAGFDLHLAKPVDPEALQALLERPADP